MRGFLLVFTLGGGPEAPATDGWFGADKARHFLSSAFVQSLAYGSLRGTGLSHGSALAGASAATAAVGVGKELHDRRTTGVFSRRDLAWDAAGAATMSVLLARTAR